jgi:DNA (cytosine-5)-methyltransferase 1
LESAKRKSSKTADPRNAWFAEALEVFDFEETGNWPDKFGRELHKFNQSSNKRIKTLSLFAGAGGLDIGFHDAGFDVSQMVEIEKSFAATLQANAEVGGVFEGAQVNAQDVRTFHADPKIKYDFIIGGPPCQTFSAAGRRAAGVKGTSDPRGVLFEEYVRLLDEIKPIGFLFENVYGIVGAEGGGPWKLIVDSFEAAGYILSYRVLDAADFGVPQHRERLFILGVRADVHEKLPKDFVFPTPSHGADSKDARKLNTAQKALVGLKSLTTKGTAISGRWGSLLPGIPPGLNYSFYTAEMGHPRPVFAWRSKFSDFLYKADPDTPVRTVKAQGGAYTGPLSWENRHFTVEEFKRLQTFPDSYALSGNRSTQIHQIGNSVPPQMARILGMSVMEQLFGGKLPIKMSYLEKDDVLGFRARKRELSGRYGAKALEAISRLEIQKTLNLEEEIQKLEGVYALGEDFELKNELDLLTQSFNIAASLSSGILRLATTVGSDSVESGFELHISPTAETSWALPFEGIQISGDAVSRECFTGGLKVFERWMREILGVEDLIQLNGYYQNKSTIAVHFASDSDSVFASAYSALVSGRLVGEIHPSPLFTSLVSRSGASIDEAMDVFRTFGFEIRNSKTNPQIPPDHYLVPYLFPTLNGRSVQRKKSLR